jgi:hypothetical protein
MGYVTQEGNLTCAKSYIKKDPQQTFWLSYMEKMIVMETNA